MPIFDGDVLRARGLVKQYKRIRAVDGIDLTVGAAERVALLGPNGAGKTTTLLMLLGVVTPDSGWVEVAGHRLPASPQRRRRARRLRRRLPAVARAAARREFLRLFGRLYGIHDPTPQVEAGLERFGITHLGDAMGNELSSGQRTLVGIVKATLHSPALLILDEPTASLDPDVALQVRTGLNRLCAEDGTALLVTSHNMVEVERLCDRVVFISRGRSSPTAAPATSRPASAATTSRACSCTWPRSARSACPSNGEGGERELAADPGGGAPARLRAATVAATVVRRGRVAGRRRLALRRDRRLLRAASRARAPRAPALLLAGILLFHVVFQAEISLATGFMEETWSRNLLNLLVTPLREGEYAAGVVLFGLAKLVIGVTVVGLVALGLFAFNITDVGLALVPIVALLLVVGWSVGMIVIGLILRVGQGAEILAWGLLAMLMPLSGIFYPVSALPGILQPIGHVLPLTHIFAAARAVLDGDGLPWDELGIAAIGALVLAVASVWFVVRMLAVFRARGYISRYV